MKRLINNAYAILLAMKRRPKSSGYTIVEVMIVLAVSAGLFTAVYLSFTIQNNRRLFAETVRTVEKNLLDIMNDVENGYYPSGQNFACKATVDGPEINSAPVSLDNKEQGAKQDCVFLGKAIQFNAKPDAVSPPQKDRFQVYTIAGNRLKSGGTLNIANTSQTLADAQPTLITNISGGPGVIVDDRFSNGPAQIYKVTAFDENGAGSPVGGFAVVNGLGGAAQVGAKAGSIRAGIIPLINTALGQRVEPDFAARVKLLSAPTAPSKGGIVVCLQEDGGGRTASIRIGANGQSTSTVVNFDKAAEDEGCTPP